jgi:hypothetical protein
MKKIMSSMALVALFAAGVVDVEAVSGRSSVKTMLGYNDSATKAALATYANSTVDAQRARSTVNSVTNDLTPLQAHSNLTTIVKEAIAHLKILDVALESIEHKRKIDDIFPDCAEAIQAAGLFVGQLIALHTAGVDTQSIVLKLIDWPIPPAATNQTTAAIASFYNAVKSEVARFQSVLNAPTIAQQEELIRQAQAESVATARAAVNGSR